jgi:urease accessory protein
MLMRTISTLIAGFSLVSGSALAHTGVGPVSGLSVGLGHPLSGLDHVLAMIAVGVLAAQLGGRSLWLVPGAFVGMIVVGGTFGLTGISVPFVEPGIVGSVIILGAIIAVGRRMPAAAAMCLVGVLAVFHGYAHATEMPANASGLTYAAGFVAATALLHLTGIGLSIGTQKIGKTAGPVFVRSSGGVIAMAGLALATVW